MDMLPKLFTLDFGGAMRCAPILRPQGIPLAVLSYLREQSDCMASPAFILRISSSA